MGGNIKLDFSVIFSPLTRPVFLKLGVTKILHCVATNYKWTLVNVITLLILIRSLANQGHVYYINKMIVFLRITISGLR